MIPTSNRGGFAKKWIAAHAGGERKGVGCDIVGLRINNQTTSNASFRPSSCDAIRAYIVLPQESSALSSRLF